MFIIIILAFIALFLLAMLYMSWLGSPIAADIMAVCGKEIIDVELYNPHKH